MDDSLYGGREQSLVKHHILRRYLLRFALIIGRKWSSITYVDGFSGPWNSQSDSYEDTSFGIAIQQLRDAKKELANSGIHLNLRAFFIEENEKAFEQLEQHVASIPDIEIGIRNGTLESSITEVCSFIREARTQTFPFVFIDPKGWSGFSLEVIQPLLNLSPSEVLINFMTQHIIRFITNDESHDSFQRLFGHADFADDLKDLKSDDRADAAVFKYRDIVATAGKFGFAGVAGILNPVKDRGHFHLIYLSRHPKGLEVFKEAEKKSMSDMEAKRAEVEQANRESGGQLELFGAEDAPESEYFVSLRNRYRQQAIRETADRLETDGRVSFDDVWQIWVSYPMVWESDLKDWIAHSEQIEIHGLVGKQRVPRRGKNHFIFLRKAP